MDKNIITKIVRFVEKHTTGLIVIIALFIVVSPLVIKLALYLTHSANSITGDGLLGYIASAFSGIIALLLGAIAIYQGNRSNMIQKGLFDKERKNKIRPIFYVSLDNSNISSTEITIENISENFAIDVNVLGKEIPFLKEGQKYRLSTDLELDNEQIKKLMVCCADVDGNVMTFLYRYVGNGHYSFYVDDLEYEEYEGE